MPPSGHRRDAGLRHRSRHVSCDRSLRATSARRQYCPPTAERRKEDQVNSRSLVMEKSNKRGKIPQSDWPLIMARYEAGETLASIARTYDCSPPAISYVVSKSRARQPARDNSATGSSGPESQLIKAIARELAATSSGGQSRHGAPIGRVTQVAGQATERRAEAMSTASDNTAAAPATPPLGNGRDHQTTRRRTGCVVTIWLNAARIRRPRMHPAEPAAGSPRRSGPGSGLRRPRRCCGTRRIRVTGCTFLSVMAPLRITVPAS